LHNLGLKDIEHEDNYIELLNKVDLLEKGEKTKLKNRSKKEKGICPTSAITGEGCDDFLAKVDKILSRNYTEFEINVDATDGKLISWLHTHAEVVSTRLKTKNLSLKIRIDEANLSRLQARLGKK
jgi:GTP-binding protein HflX